MTHPLRAHPNRYAAYGPSASFLPGDAHLSARLSVLAHGVRKTERLEAFSISASGSLGRGAMLAEVHAERFLAGRAGFGPAHDPIDDTLRPEVTVWVWLALEAAIAHTAGEEVADSPLAVVTVGWLPAPSNEDLLADLALALRLPVDTR